MNKTYRCVASRKKGLSCPMELFVRIDAASSKVYVEYPMEVEHNHRYNAEGQTLTTATKELIRAAAATGLSALKIQRKLQKVKQIFCSMCLILFTRTAFILCQAKCKSRAFLNESERKQAYSAVTLAKMIFAHMPCRNRWSQTIKTRFSLLVILWTAT